MTQPLLRFIHISDTHISDDPEYKRGDGPHTPYEGSLALVAAINALPFQPDFILHTGDVAYDPYPQAYAAVRSLLGQLKAPVYYLRGNHDHSAALQTELLGRSAQAVQPYLYYELEVQGVQLLCLDSNGPADLPAGYLPQEQLDWLDERCAADDERPLLIAIHHNVLPASTPWLDNWMRLTNGEDVHAVIRQARDRLRGVVHGHIHQNVDVLADGVRYASVVSPWLNFMAYPDPANDRVSVDEEARPGFSVVSLDAERCTIRRHSFSVTPRP